MGEWLRWLVPAAAVALGVGVAAAGFAYDLAFAGIPYQDPTPEMEARWRYHSGVASTIELAGVAVAAIGVTGLAVVGVWSLAVRHTKPAVTPDRNRDAS